MRRPPGVAGGLPAMSLDTRAHEFEHSIEVQLPFIAYFSGNARIAVGYAGVVVK